jgi:6-pyruvoyl-tetrahydropterin synthase
MTEIFSLFVKDFTHLDGAIMDPVRGPLGISYILGIEFIGRLNNEGVVFDFSHAKKCAKKVVDETADHAFTVSKYDLKELSANLCEIKFNGSEVYSYRGPTQAFFAIESSTENCLFATLETLIFEECKKNKDCADLVQVKLIPKLEQATTENEFFFQYTHGLSQHYGNCQRLVHGHRSTINVKIDGSRNEDYEHALSAIFHNVHLAYSANIIGVNKERNTVDIQYTASQGKFTLTLPRDVVMRFPVETTVENIAKYSANFVAFVMQIKGHNFKEIEVTAYEGIDKGCKYSLTQSLLDRKILDALMNEAPAAIQKLLKTKEV